MDKEKSEFLRNLFFYIISFVGLMIFVFSIVSFITGFFSVGYPKPPISKPMPGTEPVIPKPYLHIDARSLISGGTGTVVGFFVWIFSWRTIQKEHSEDK